jgi:hypothetical protein
MTTRYPYIVSNRDFTTPAKIGDPYPNIGKELSFWLAVPPYDQTQKISQGNYGKWLNALLNEITDGRVTIFIHGYANPWTKVIDTSDATHGLAAMIGHFWSYPGLTLPPFRGPIVIFDWPSTGLYKPAQDRGLQTATKFFNNPSLSVDLKRIIDDIARQKPGTRINFVCHSMGNYVFAKGAGYLTPNSVTVAFMNAAAIDNKSFDLSGQSPTQADGIQKCIGSAVGTGTLIMNTTHDDVLPLAPDPWTELGITNVAPAPKYYPCTGGFDLSDIVDKAHQDGAESIHVAYYYIPLVLDLMNKYLNYPATGAVDFGTANSPLVKRINVLAPA